MTTSPVFIALVIFAISASSGSSIDIVRALGEGLVRDCAGHVVRGHEEIRVPSGRSPTASTP